MSSRRLPLPHEDDVDRAHVIQQRLRRNDQEQLQQEQQEQALQRVEEREQRRAQRVEE